MSSITLPAHVLRGIRRQAGMPAFLTSLHPGGQRAFVEDKAARKAALCSRRAGKSHGIACWLVDGAEKRPDGLSCFIALTRQNARQIAWRALQKLERQYRIGLEFKTEDGQLYVVHPNQHRIWLSGCADRSEIDKFRGNAFDRVAVDEAQAFAGYLQELVEDVLEPTLLDTNGQLALTGTPGAVCAGYFHAVTTGQDNGVAAWPTHRWTVLDNRAIPHAADWLEQRRTSHRWDASHPTYRREWLGEWVNDSGALVYPLSRALNGWDGVLPPGEYSYALGVDLGFAPDATAFVVVACRKGQGHMYVIEAEKKVGLIPAAVVARVEQYRSRYRFSRIVVDEGGLGKGYAEQMRADGIPCEPAEKHKKRAAQEWTKGEILAGCIHVDWAKARALADECLVLSWNEDGDAEDERFENHCADAFLYASRSLWPLYRPEEDAPKEGTREWEQAERAKARQAEITKRERRQKRQGLRQLVGMR